MFDGTKDTIDIPRARFTESNALSVSVPVNLPGRIGLMIFLPETNNASAFVDPGIRRLVTGTYDGSDIRLSIRRNASVDDALPGNDQRGGLEPAGPAGGVLQ